MYIFYNKIDYIKSYIFYNKIDYKYNQKCTFVQMYKKCLRLAVFFKNPCSFMPQDEKSSVRGFSGFDFFSRRTAEKDVFFLGWRGMENGCFFRNVWRVAIFQARKKMRMICRRKQKKISAKRRFQRATGWNRTNDTWIFSPLLYQLSYSGIKKAAEGSRTLVISLEG